MAKKRKRGRAPKRIAGVKLGKPMRRALRPFAKVLASELGRDMVAEAVVALAIAFATTDKMRDAFRAAAHHARRTKQGVAGVALHLGRAALLPMLVTLHASLPDPADRRRAPRKASEAMH